jgi:5'-AMP-activated protein kinase beta subunit, interaction domain
VWTRTIPPYVDQIPDTPIYNGQYASKSSLVDDDIIPPALPRQLEKPFLNQNHVQKEDQSVLPIPVHVVAFLETTLILGCIESLGGGNQY